jgi:hypothetical protein
MIMANEGGIMTNPAMNPPADWYPDPHDSTKNRYWDGTQWTSSTMHSATVGPGTVVEKKPARVVPFWGVIVALVFGFILGAVWNQFFF